MICLCFDLSGKHILLAGVFRVNSSRGLSIRLMVLQGNWISFLKRPYFFLVRFTPLQKTSGSNLQIIQSTREHHLPCSVYRVCTTITRGQSTAWVVGLTYLDVVTEKTETLWLGCSGNSPVIQLVLSCAGVSQQQQKGDIFLERIISDEMICPSLNGEHLWHNSYDMNHFCHPDWFWKGSLGWV